MLTLGECMGCCFPIRTDKALIEVPNKGAHFMPNTEKMIIRCRKRPLSKGCVNQSFSAPSTYISKLFIRMPKKGTHLTPKTENYYLFVTERGLQSKRRTSKSFSTPILCPKHKNDYLWQKEASNQKGAGSFSACFWNFSFIPKSKEKLFWPERDLRSKTWIK